MNCGQYLRHFSFPLSEFKIPGSFLRLLLTDSACMKDKFKQCYVYKCKCHLSNTKGKVEVLEFKT